MDAGFIITWKELLIAGIFVLGIFIAKLLLLMRSRQNGGLGFWHSGAAKPELAEVNNKLAALETRLTKLEEGTGSANTFGEIAPNAYSMALSLVKQGMDVAQVAVTCGISRAEAELIVAMQRNPLH